MSDIPEPEPEPSPTETTQPPNGDKKKKKKKKQEEEPIIDPLDDPQEEVDNIDYYKKPPTDAEISRMTNDQIVTEVIEQRKRRDYWIKDATRKKRENNEAKNNFRTVRKRKAEIKAKINELDTEKQYLEVEAQVVSKNQEIKLKREEDDFCADILELERHLDNNEVIWHNQACELRDDDVVNTNEHLLKEERIHLEIEEVRRSLALELQRLKALKHAHVRRTKLYDFQELHLNDIQLQCEQRGITPNYLAGRKSITIDSPYQSPIALGGASIASSDRIIPSRRTISSSIPSPRPTIKASPRSRRTAGHDIVMDLHKQVFETNNKFANSKSKESSKYSPKSQSTSRPKDPLRFLFRA